MKAKTEPKEALTEQARQLLGEISEAGKLNTKSRAKAAAELESKGLIHLSKGKATLTKAGRFCARSKDSDNG